MSRPLILAWHVDRSRVRGCELTVATDAGYNSETRRTEFEARRRTFDHYPTETDIAETASAGAKVSPGIAGQLFAHLTASGYKYRA